jgi:opacity protein-like surface antigen
VLRIDSAVNVSTMRGCYRAGRGSSDFPGAIMTTLRQFSTCCAVTALVAGMAIGASSTASAQSQADFVQMMAAMKRLEARVAALEGENKQAKQEAAAARAEARGLRQKMGAAAPSSGAGAPNVTAVPPGIYAMVTKAPVLPPVASWGGLYWGAAFGIGWMRAAVTETSTEALNELFSDSPTFTTIATSNSALSGRNAGDIANLYLGYNLLATPTVVLSGQIEGGVSNIRVNLSGSGSTSTRGTNGGFTTIATTTFNSTDTLDNRWMLSALGRGGVLVDPADFVYLLGGYTYARFEAFGVGFGLNGGTIGAGWERQVTPSWTLRGEYRYTKFEGKDINQNSVSNFVQTTTSNGGSSTLTDNDVSATTRHLSADMHSVWIGVAHQFGQ